MWEQKLHSILRKVEERKELCKSRSVVMRYGNMSFQRGCIHGVAKTLLEELTQVLDSLKGQSLGIKNRKKTKNNIQKAYLGAQEISCQMLSGIVHNLISICHNLYAFTRLVHRTRMMASLPESPQPTEYLYCWYLSFPHS